ncbi:MAG: adventurous gliding motility lipoprotein CglB [Myxococcaceae bacterium]
MNRLVTALACATVACQSYDFEPVEPLALTQTTQRRVITARAPRPDVMLLVDKSGSMDLPIDPGDPDCILPNTTLCGRKGAPDSQPCNTSVCPTRWSELQEAMSNFLPASGIYVRYGLALFPGGTTATLGPPGCFEPSTAASGGVTRDIIQSQDVPLELQAQAQTVLSDILAVSSSNPPGASGTGGGTPAGPALTMLGQYAPLTTQQCAGDQCRERFVLLLTDGLPNCNPANPNSYNVDPVACDCALDPVRCAVYPREMCSDRTGTVSAITNLSGLGVKTIVVGFGADTAGVSAQTTLNGMATAGGFARTCGTPGGPTCSAGEQCISGFCENRFYPAANRTELETALSDISARVVPGLCDLELDARPSENEFISVTFEGENLVSGPNTWTYILEGAPPGRPILRFPAGQYCDRIEASTALDPLDLVVQIVTGL